MSADLIPERPWPRVDVTLSFFSENLAPDEMIAIAQVEPDIATPAFRTRWGATVGRPSAIYGLTAFGTDLDDASSVIEQLSRRVIESNAGLVALSEESDATVLSVAFYLQGNGEAPGLQLNGEQVQVLVALGADLQLAIYRDHE